MSSRATEELRKPNVLRTVLSVVAALAATLVVFQFIAAFNGVLKVVNRITSEMAYRCRDGFTLTAAEDGTAVCKPNPPPPPPGVVPVTLSPLTPPPSP